MTRTCLQKRTYSITQRTARYAGKRASNDGLFEYYEKTEDDGTVVHEGKLTIVVPSKENKA